MGCQKTLTLSETIAGETPLDDACYVPAPVDKIFGTQGPHVVKFNATTGIRESFVRVTAPAHGMCRLCYHAPLSMIYVSIWNLPNNQWTTVAPWARRGLYPVNPVSMAIGSPLNVATFAAYDEEWVAGPRAIFSAGSTYLYFSEGNGDAFTGVDYWRVNPLNTADRFHPTWGESVGGANAFNQFDASATHFYAATAGWYELHRHDLNLTNASYEYCTLVAPEKQVDNPVSIAYSIVNTTAYAVCGTAKLIRGDVFDGGGGSYTALTMNSVSVTGMPALTTVQPVRLRYRTSDSKLYIPCQAQNAVIVWDPTAETGVWKTGFNSPIDVVFTATKAFAVQNSAVGLLEIP